jgi:hypothetical protein
MAHNGISMEGYTIYKLALVILAVLHQTLSTHPLTRIHTIHWNSSNPLFTRADGPNVIDINGGNHHWEYDQVNIVCPVYKTASPTGRREQYIIYSVTQHEYDSCRITQPNPKIVALCNRPHELMYFTITFRSFTPTPGGLEFRPGQDYYFISTSSRNDLHRRVGGGCSSENMKVMFRVADAKKNKPSSILESVVPPNASESRFPWSRKEDFRRVFSLYSLEKLKQQHPNERVDYGTVKRHSSSSRKTSSGLGGNLAHSSASASLSQSSSLHAIKLVTFWTIVAPGAMLLLQLGAAF